METRGMVCTFRPLLSYQLIVIELLRIAWS